MRATRSFVAVAMTALAVSSCSSSSSGGENAGNQASTQTDASTYVDGVCTALADWQSGLDADNVTMESTLSSGKPTLDDTKTALVDFLSSTVDGTKTMVSDIEALGVPDVEGGEGAASTLSAALGETVTLFQGVLDDVEGLSTDDPAGMATALNELATSISQGSEGIGSALSDLDVPELREAAGESEACAAIAG